jgi:hypothetical protein
MIGRREHRIAVIIEIIIRLGMRAVILSIRQNHFSHFCEDLIRTVQFSRDSCNGFQTRTAETRRGDGILSQTGEDVVGHNDLMAPARALIEMSLGHATIIIAGTEGTLLIVPKAVVRRWRRSFWNWLPRLHDSLLR